MHKVLITLPDDPDQFILHATEVYLWAKDRGLVEPFTGIERAGSDKGKGVFLFDRERDAIEFVLRFA